MKLKFSFFIAIFLLQCSPSFAGFWKDAGNDFISPVTTDAKYVFYGGSLITILFTFDPIEDKWGHKIQADTIEDKPLGRTSIYGDLAGQMIPNAIYAATAWSLGKWSDNQGYNAKAVHMVKSTLYAALFTSILKYTIREPRPNSNNREAFPSGHTTTAFAFASVVATEHEWYWAVPAYTLASFTAFSRINDNAHQFHDVIAGAVIGTSYGLSIYYMDKKKESFITKTFVMPYDDGLIAMYKTTF